MIAQVPLPVAGVHAEIHPNELPPTALSDGENWVLRDGRMRVRNGLTVVGQDTNDRPNGFLGYIDATGVPVLLMGTDDTVFVFDDASQLWVDLTAGFTADYTHSTLFEVFMLSTTATVYIQNGIDAPKRWAFGDAAVAAVTGTNMPIARAMMVLADRLLLGNIVAAGGSYAGALGPSVVTVSASQDPANGYDLTDGLVAQLADTPGAIVAMQEIGNLQGVIYKTDAIYLATASGSNVPFTFELKKAGTPGPVSPRAVVRASDGLQYYLARDGNVMVFDGIEPRPLGRHIQRYVLNTWDFDTSFRAHGVYDDENRELVFFYPGVGASEPNHAIVVQVDSSSLWPFRWDTIRITAAIKASLPGGATIGDFVGDFSVQTLTLGEYDALGQTFLYGDTGGQCFAAAGTLDNEAAIHAYFETGSSGFEEPLRFKSVAFIDHLFDTSSASQDVSVTLKKSNYGEDLLSDTARTLNVGSGGPYRTHHRFPGRKYAMRVEADATVGIEWQGATVSYATQGSR